MIENTSLTDITITYDSSFPVLSLRQLELDDAWWSNGSLTLVQDVPQTLEVNDEYIGRNGEGTFILNDGIHNVVAGGPGAAGFGTLYLGFETLDPAGLRQATGNFIQNGGSLSALTTYLGYGVNTSGRYEMNGGAADFSYLTVGHDGNGAVAQTGGDVNVSQVSYIGRSSGGSGVYTMSGGTLRSDDFIVGSSGSGAFVQSGTASHSVGNRLILGFAPGSSGSYTINGGSLGATSFGGQIIVGSEGRGTFNQSGGTVIAGDLVLGEFAGGNGTYDLTAGSLSIYEIVDGFGTGTFNLDGGTLTVRSGTVGVDHFNIGRFSGANASFSIGTGESLSAAVDTAVGYQGDGSLLQTDGTHNVGRWLRLGVLNGAHGSYQLDAGSLDAGQSIVGEGGNGGFVQNGGSHAAGWLFVGDRATGIGAYTLTGGTLQVAADNASIIGNFGDGLFDHRGGTHTTDELILGLQSSTSPSGSGLDVIGGRGEYLLSGTGTLMSNRTSVGIHGAGRFTQSGGSHDTGELHVGFKDLTRPAFGFPFSLDDFTGEYDLLAGTLNSGNAFIGNGYQGTFRQSGGTHTVAGTLAVGLLVSDPPTSAVGIGQYELSNGDLDTFATTVGDGGIGTFLQTGGLHDISSDLTLGASGTGDYVLSGGSLTVGGNIVNGAGTSSLSIDGGSVSVVGGSIGVDQFNVGSSAGTSGSFVLNTGETLAVEADEIVGLEGTGAFTQHGGDNTIGNNLAIGSRFGSGSYVQHAGNIAVGNNMILGGVGTPGIPATGQFTQHGGTTQVANDLILGEQRYSSGDYQLNNGSLVVAGDLILGRTQSSGQFTQSGGSNRVTGTLAIADALASNGGVYDLQGGMLDVDTVNLRSGGAFNFSGGQLRVATFNASLANDSGTLAVRNGAGGTTINGDYSFGNTTQAINAGEALNVSGNVNVAASGDADVVQQGGSHSVGGNLVVAQQRFSNGGYQLHAGNLNVAGDTLIGRSGSTGQFTQTGGTHTITGTLAIATALSSAGTYDLQGGVLDAQAIQITTNGSFGFTGGQLSVDTVIGDLANNGGTLAPGQSPGVTHIMGDYSQSLAGTLAIEIGGPVQGVDYDWLNIDGTADLAGVLDVSVYDSGSGPFAPQLGDVFDVLSAATIVGAFDTLTFRRPGDGLGWDISYILDDFGTDFVRLTVVDYVPLPAAVWLFAGGLLVLVRAARR